MSAVISALEQQNFAPSLSCGGILNQPELLGGKDE